MFSRPTAGQWVLAELYQSGYDKLLSNLFWFKADGITFDSTFDYKGSGDAVIAALTNDIKGTLATTQTILGGSVLFGMPAGSYGVDVYQSQVGTGPAGSALPEDVAVVVQKNTDLLGPTNRGRWFFSGAPQAFANGNYLGSGGHTAFLALANLLNQPIVLPGGGSIPPATFSPKIGTLQAISACSPVALLATSRRRRPRF
jgi:hypothetical protein